MHLFLTLVWVLHNSTILKEIWVAPFSLPNTSLLFSKIVLLIIATVEFPSTTSTQPYLEFFLGYIHGEFIQWTCDIAPLFMRYWRIPLIPLNIGINSFFEPPPNTYSLPQTPFYTPNTYKTSYHPLEKPLPPQIYAIYWLEFWYF